MNQETVPPALRNLVADTLEIDNADVTPDLTSDQVSSWDSFRHLQLILSIEEEYGVQFDPQRLPELTSVASLQAELLRKGVTL
jgi:acyl carrier protein